MFYIIATVLAFVATVIGLVAEIELVAALGMALTLGFGLGYVVDIIERHERR